MAEEIDFEMSHFRNYRTFVTLTLDWVIRHTECTDTPLHRVSLIGLYLCTKFRANWKNFLWTDERMDGH